jgi:ribosomal protein L33
MRYAAVRRYCNRCKKSLSRGLSRMIEITGRRLPDASCKRFAAPRTSPTNSEYLMRSTTLVCVECNATSYITSKAAVTERLRRGPA